MGLLDIFSGENGRNAAIWSAGNTQAGANQQRGYLGAGAEQGLAALGQGYNQAVGTLAGQYNNSAASLWQGLGNATGTLNQNPATYQAYGANADAMYAPLGAEANRGFSTYGDAAGVNGAAGQNRATQNFRAGPGYNFQLNQGIDAATRAAAAGGMAASGNTMQSAQRFGSGLADQEYQKYMQNLQPYLNLASGIAGKRADIQQHIGDQIGTNTTNLAGLYSGAGRDMSALSTGYGNTLASLASGYGSNQAGIYGDLSRNLSNVTGAETAAVTGQGQAGLMAGQTANQNTWNAGMQLANLAAGNAGKVANAFA